AGTARACRIAGGCPEPRRSSLAIHRRLSAPSTDRRSPAGSPSTPRAATLDRPAAVPRMRKGKTQTRPARRLQRERRPNSSCWTSAAYRTLGIARNAHLTPLHRKGVEDQQPPRERFAHACDELQRLGGL